MSCQPRGPPFTGPATETRQRAGLTRHPSDDAVGIIWPRAVTFPVIGSVRAGPARVLEGGWMDDVETIKQRKDRYCRLVETKDWAGYGKCFTDDVTKDTTESGGNVITHSDAFLTFLTAKIADGATVRQATPPRSRSPRRPRRPGFGRWRTWCGSRTDRSSTGMATSTSITKGEMASAHHGLHAHQVAPRLRRPTRLVSSR
jgi:SnoaL-like domain